MQCFNCGSIVQLTDHFCQKCGVSLTPNPRSNSPRISCHQCGAPPEAITLDGWCSICGFEHHKTTYHYLEINPDPHLGGVSFIGEKPSENQDFLEGAKIPEKNTYVFVVCDGVSNSESPEIAARIAAEMTCKSLVKTISNHVELRAAIIQGFSDALEQICLIPHTDPTKSPSSTTIVTAIVQDKNAKIVWLGNSRAYWISSQESRLLTQDDSWFNWMISSGKMNPEKALNSPYSHAITQWLGADIADDIQLSMIDFSIPSSGYLLLCSDGLWNYIPKANDLANLVYEKSNEDALTIAKRLVEWACLQGGHDNITVAILAID